MKFLVLQHVEHEHSGFVAEYCKEKGIELNVVELWKPYTIPEPDDYQALIILGGPMGVYENYPSKDDETNLIQKVLGKIPILGFCLGAQLLAHVFGSKVYKNEKDGKPLKEIGYYDVSLTPSGQANALFKDFSSPVKVLQWHGDTFDLPEGAELLATAPNCANQAFKLKNAYALQFHIEFTEEMVNKLLIADKEWIHSGFNIDEATVRTLAKDYNSLMKQSCYKLLDNFTSTF